MWWYKLDENKIPVECSIEEATEWLSGVDADKRRVGLSSIVTPTGEFLRLSTVFLGYKDDDDMFFETMIFPNIEEEISYETLGQWSGDYQKRYRTYQEAEDGHEELLEKIKQGWTPGNDRKIIKLKLEPFIN